MKRYQWNVAAMFAIVCSLGTVASADMITVEAMDNATVQPGGPRTGANGKAFFNIEGSANGSFASYGVADFTFPVPTTPYTSIDSVSIKLTQSNASFTTNGQVLFSLDTRSTLVSMQPGTSPLAFGGGDPGTSTDVSQGDLVLEAFTGSYPFNKVSNGTIDSYALGMTPAIETELLNRLNNGQPIRMVIGTGGASVAATWAGSTNFNYAGPTLTIEASAIPEPTSGALAIVFVAIVAAAKRR